MPSTLRWLAIHTSTPARTRSAAISAWMSEKPMARSGFRARIAPVRALVKALTLGFSRRARGGRTVKPLMPTMRSCSPSAYRVSVGSSVRQTMRRGPISARRRLRGSRLQHPLRPAAFAITLVAPALVQAVARAVPELERARHDPEPAPARRSRHLATLEARLYLRQGGIERLARRQRGRLFGRPGAELAHARAAGEIGIGLGIVHQAGLAFHPYLDPCLAQVPPQKQQRRLRIAAQVAPLGAVQVGVEDEPARVERLQQHGARMWTRKRVDGGHGHRVGIGDAAGTGLLQQLAEGLQGLGIQRIGHEGSSMARGGYCGAMSQPAHAAGFPDTLLHAVLDGLAARPGMQVLG